MSSVTYVQRNYDDTVECAVANGRAIRVSLQHRSFINDRDLPRPTSYPWQARRLNTPSSAGYIFVDAIQRRILELTNGLSVAEVAYDEIAPLRSRAFVRDANTMPGIRRRSVREFVKGVRYSEPSVEGEIHVNFAQPLSDKGMLAILKRFGPQRRPFGFLRAARPTDARFVMSFSDWEIERFDMTAEGVRKAKSAVSAACSLSDEEVRIWSDFADNLDRA